MADSDSNELIFTGSGPEELQSFVSTIRRRALAEKKHMDNQWIAFLASSCFFGEAFYWYEDLDKEIQEDWSRLRPALVARFGRRPAPHTSSLSTSMSPVSAPPSNIPTPAAAPPAQITSPSTRQGRLKVLNLSGAFVGYMANPIGDGTCNVLTKALDQTLSVSFASPQGKKVFELSLVTSSQVSTTSNDALAIAWPYIQGTGWMGDADYDAWCCSWSRMRATNDWATARNVWELSEDCELSARYPKPNGGYEPLRPYISHGSALVFCKAFVLPSGGYDPVRLIFEEIQ